MTNTFFGFLIFNLLFIFTNCENSDPSIDQSYRFQSSIVIDGLSRTYLVNLPQTYYDIDSKLPVVIGLHGTGGSADQFDRNYGLTERANELDFIAVYPEGVRSDRTLKLRTWNAGTCCDYARENNIDDTKFISRLIDQLILDYRIDPKKLYVTGMSNGGMLAYRLACEIPEKIAAIAPVSCSMMVESPCNPSRPIPILHIHSILDTKIPYSGGVGIGGYYFPPVDSVLNVWSINNTCTVSGNVVVDNADYKLLKWLTCADDVTIQTYLTKDGGHSWPGGSKPSQRSDAPSTVINASALILDFFKTYELP